MSFFFWKKRPTQLDRIELMLSELLLLERIDMTTLDEAFADLKAKVAANTDQEKSASQALAGISQQLRDLSVSKPSFTAADIMAVAQQIDANNTDLAAAIVNTTTPPAPVTVPEPAAPPTPETPPAETQPAPASAEVAAPASAEDTAAGTTQPGS